MSTGIPSRTNTPQGTATGAGTSVSRTPSTSSEVISEAKAKAAARMLTGSLESGFPLINWDLNGAYATLKQWSEQ